MLEGLYSLKEDLTGSGIFFCFSGPISQNLVREIGEILNQKMDSEDAGRTTIIRLFSMVVETGQNIIHYSDEKDQSQKDGGSGTSRGIITIGYENGSYFVVSGNRINNEKVPRLREKLEKLRSMDKKELRQYYLERIKKEPDEGSKGAGLGFIEMARKAGRPIEYHFRKIDDKNSFFSIRVVL